MCSFIKDKNKQTNPQKTPSSNKILHIKYTVWPLQIIYMIKNNKNFKVNTGECS